MNIPYEVLNSYNLDPKKILISSISNDPWEKKNVYLVTQKQKNKEKLIFKNWDINNIGRLNNEIKMLEWLNEKKSNLSPYIISPNNKIPWVMSGDKIWSVYEHIKGITYSQTNNNAISDIAKLLVEFHEITLNNTLKESSVYALRKSISSILSDLKKINEFTDISFIISFFENKIYPLTQETDKLQRCQIHGDFNFENIIVNEKKYTLIDFEFTRIDIKLYDIVSMYAPFRTTQGEFKILNEYSFHEFIKCYNRNSTLTKLNSVEEQLLPYIGIIHFSKILVDITGETDFKVISSVINVIKYLMDKI
ncbi:MULTISPECIES: phosphotransferase [Bacillus]|uniref:phosphotransferase n=1 Tax=Bacillus TaxID=1386 RepID=UPI0020CE1248|nr:phosphotransferase [Bacillus safensis]MCP9282883.1 phosphotransferase [Bacillus safensis]